MILRGYHERQVRAQERRVAMSFDSRNHALALPSELKRSMMCSHTSIGRDLERVRGRTLSKGASIETWKDVEFDES